MVIGSAILPDYSNDDVKQKTDKGPIVCGTDFSTTAAEATNIAAAMARRLGTELVLVHVEEFYGLAGVDPKLFAEALSGKRTALDQEATRLRSLGTQVKDKLLSGSAFDQLATAATDAQGRLIVVGAVGHGLVRRVFLGKRSGTNSGEFADSNVSCTPGREARFLDSRRACDQDSCGIRFFRRQRRRFGLGK